MPTLALLALALFGQTTPPQTKPPTPPAKTEKKDTKKKEEKKEPKKREEKPKKQERPVALLETTKGTIQIELEPTEAPVAVSNFIALVRRSYYDGLTFHRVEPELVQGGDPKGDGTGGPGYTIPYEQNRGLKNLKGVVGMARQANDRNSAGSQFYLLKKDAPGFDANGYTLFGRIIAGQDTVEKLSVGDKIVRASVTLPPSFTARPFGPSRRAEPESLFPPDLPEDLSERRFTAEVRVKVTITPQGSATAVLTKGSGDEDIDDAILLAIKRWKWQPALKDGQPTNDVQEFDYDLATNSRRYERKK